MLAQELGGQRYSDPAIASLPAHILPAEVDTLRTMMMALMQQPDQFNHWFGEFISQSLHELDLAPPYLAGEIYDLLNQGESLFRVGGLRVLQVGDDSYVNGEKIVTPHREAAAALAARYDISREQLGDALEDPSFLALLAGLINSGYWYFKNRSPTRLRLTFRLLLSAGESR